MKTLILFSTRDGQTREIASYLASELKELGIQADVANVHRIEEPQWENYDRVVIGASIRYVRGAFSGLNTSPLAMTGIRTASFTARI